ncbi:MAG TPA: hypothetical protein VHC20_00380 [Candidatus Paceibacterota bacterium]|nr:hypothetical protein [Candidatus Paceibacterota bacterium]
MSKNLELENLKKEVAKVSDDTVWGLYAHLVQELRDRKLVRTRNITGERGEFLAIKAYKETIGLPKLQAARELTKNVDALSGEGKRYTIKTVSQKTVNTGIFAGLAESHQEPTEQKFEYVVIVVLDRDLQADLILELTWDQFMALKYWNGGMKGWGLTVNQKLISMAKIIYQKPDSLTLRGGWKKAAARSN